MLPLEKVVYLDADMLIMRNIDGLFDIELGEEPDNMIAAVPDVAPPDEFNTGLFVTKPSLRRFTELMRLSERYPSWNGGDQGFLQTVFQGWYSGPSQFRLPYEYNVQTKMRVLYEAAWMHIYDRIRVFHFSPHKPWKDPHRKSKDFGDFNERWWKMLELAGENSKKTHLVEVRHV